MKVIRWLLALSGKSPLQFSIALLMIAIATMAVIIKNRDNKLEEANEERRIALKECGRKADSLANAYAVKEAILNKKVEDVLNSIIADYKQQLEEQKNLNKKVNTTIDKNRRIINNSRQ